MSPAAVEFFYDYVDPASYLVDQILGDLADEMDVDVSHRPFEIRRPPAPMVDPAAESWRRYRSEMDAAAQREGLELGGPRMIPWSRKAHELALHAREEGVFPAVHRALFRAHFAEDRDIGRVDVLVEIAGEAGLDPGHVKAVLDVDRHLPVLEDERTRAHRLGVRGVPTLLTRNRGLEGFRPRAEIRTFLARIPSEP